MRKFVIFSKDEINNLVWGLPVYDEENDVTYMSEYAYKNYLEELRERRDEKWE